MRPNFITACQQSGVFSWVCLLFCLSTGGWGVPVQGPSPLLLCTGLWPLPRHVQTCSTWTSLYRTPPLLPSPHSNWLTMKYRPSENRRLTFDWNAFLFFERKTKVTISLRCAHRITRVKVSLHYNRWKSIMIHGNIAQAAVNKQAVTGLSPNNCVSQFSRS